MFYNTFKFLALIIQPKPVRSILLSLLAFILNSAVTGVRDTPIRFRAILLLQYRFL